ncbi:MAG: HAD family phosphatase [Lachnospiraceae bacterium]|nr:HAD family phosphatase [Lachnospiraceae bacterium]
MKKIKNIIFDMGNVLLKFDPWISLNYYCKNEEEKQIIFKELFKGPEWIMGDEGKLTNGQRYEYVKNRVPEELHRTLKLVVENWDMCMKEVAGAKEFVHEMKEKGYRCYVLSNACNRFYHYFPASYDLGLFEKIIVSSDLKMIKPNKEIYRHLLSACSLEAEECLFLDDVEENVEAAKAEGIRGIVFQNNYGEIKKMLATAE